MIRPFICLVAGLILSLAVSAQSMMSKEIPFMTPFAPKSAIITDYEHKDTVNAPFSLVRLTNKKVVYMSKENGVMQPFFIKAIETGYWDTRYHPDTDYNKVFADMKGIGANTAYVMLHWEDIETQDNKFDFSFSDKVTNAAAKQGLKIKWILFLHAQRDKVPTENLRQHGLFTSTIEIRPIIQCNGQNETEKYIKILRVCSKMAEFVRCTFTGIPKYFTVFVACYINWRYIIATIQQYWAFSWGNEEGFSFLDESDFNPVTSALYEEWKLKTNKTDYALFKKDAMDWWWKQFTTAYHEGDPYKIISFNLDAGQAEANDPKRVEMTGTSAATYADGNLDAIGTMLYKHWGGEKALLGLDIHYGNMYNYRLPVLIPSEIGIGSFNSLPYFRRFTAQTLERAAQGFGVYCYGEVREELPNKVTEREALTRIFSNITSNVDIIYPGLPGPGYAVLTAKDDNIKSAT